MAKGVNKVILIGNLGDDPKVITTDSGTTIANVSLATSESWKDKAGEKQERTEWHRLVCFNRLAEIVGEYLHKGSKVYVEGKIQTRKWQDQEGQDRYSTEIVVHDMQMLDAKPGGAQQQAPQQESRRQAPQQQSRGSEEPFDDDLPF